MNLNISEINREKINNSQDPILKHNPKIRRKIPKTPDIQNINYKKNTQNSQRRKISTYSLEPNSNFQPLTLTKEENQNDYYDILYKKYLITISKYEQIVSELSNINKKLESNSGKLEELKEKLKKLREEKKQKQIDIVNLLSNKESLEEIYKNKIYYLVKKKDLKSNQKIDNIDEIWENTHKITDSESFRIDEEKELEINIDEIKKSEKKKFIEQVINFAEDILQKNEDEFNNKIKEKINLAYKVFYNEINCCSITIDSIVANFFSRIGVFISNHSLGNYSELIINKFLRYLLKMNSIGIEIFHVIKFLNKRYKEYKNEIKGHINNYIKKNENLVEKKNDLEKRREELENKIEKKKENLKNLEKNKDSKEFENNMYVNITSDSLYSFENVNNFRKHNTFKLKKNNIINNSKNENLYNNFNKISNYRDKYYVVKSENNNIEKKEQIYEYNNKNIRKNKTKLNRENNQKEENNEINKIETNKDIEDINIALNKKINNKGKKINANKILKIKNNKVNELGQENQKNKSLKETVVTNNNINIENNISQINSDLNNNLKEIGKNSTINVNNLFINNDIKIKNINDIINSPENDNNFDKNNLKEKSEIKSDNSRIYYSKKKIENMKINKNNNSNNVMKGIVVNNNNNSISKKENNIMNYKKSNNLEKEINNSNTNLNFSIIKKPQYNKNIYIINNINNSDNSYNNVQFTKVNNSKFKQKNENKINDYNYNKKSFEKNNKNLNNKNNNTDNNKKKVINETKGEKSNQSYNFHDIFHPQNKQRTINNKLLNNLNFENIKLIPIKNLSNLKLNNISNSPSLSLQPTKKNKIIFRKNNTLELKNNNNTKDEISINKVRKKLTDNNINNISNRDNNNLKINFKEQSSNNDKIKISKIPISSLNNRIYTSNNEGKKYLK